MLDKALLLMRILATVRESAPMGVSELARRSGLAKSTVHRLLAAQDLVLAIDGGYVLGGRLTRWMDSIGTGGDLARLRQMAVPYLVGLHEAVPAAVAALGVLSGARVRYLDSVHGHQPPPAPALASWAPAHCTAIGKLLLTYLGDAEIAKALGPGPYRRYTPRTRCTPDELGADFEEIRRNGIAIERQEYRVGIVCVAAPVHSRKHRAIAAISLCHSTRTDVYSATRQLRAAADGLTRDLANSEH
ncbi:IclR family transcriptional regulator [Nocardia brasiliensis]